MQGASPLASPGLGGTRHWGCLWKAGYGGGGLPSWLPAAPAFSLLCCPHPPNPLPRRGRGRLRLFHARGFAPCIPGAGWDAALGLLVESGVRRGGLPFWLPAAPAFSLLCCPPSPKGKDIPPTRARRALFPAGRGRLRLFHARGFAPCIPGAGWDAALGLLVESGLRRGACPGGTGAWWALMRPAGGLPSWSPADLTRNLRCFSSPFPGGKTGHKP
mgnify:CR=1 FL=1